MKKLVSTFLVCAFLGISAMSVSAASPTEVQQSGEVNLDPIMADYVDYMGTDPTEGIVKLFDSRKVNVAAGGGEFWVEWGLDRHWSNYNHPTKIHRSSASNNIAIRRSSWENPRNLASVWIKSSLWGNKANWATK